MDDTDNQVIFAVAMAIALGVLCIGLERAAERWKWFRIAGCALVLLIYAVLGVMGVLTFLSFNDA